MDDVMFSSKSDLWSTPDDFFAELDKEFHFTLDVCATADNAKCDDYYTEAMDGLRLKWDGIVWCNPPYGRNINKWIKKAVNAALGGATVVMLLPARTDTKWFHELVYRRAEIRFVRGRLKFGGSNNAAPFPSMICIFG